MPHVLKKYISNRGSALFMVLSTMTALLISTMAMYFSMVSSRASQYTMFNHTQATQSADSIAMIVYRAIGNVGNQASTGGGVLLEKMKALAVGESISTNADAFESMNPTSAGAKGKLDPEQLGAYSVIITRLEDSAAGNPRYDLNVMSSVDGNRDSVHYVFSYNETPPGDDPANAGDMKLFTATGYLPNDAYINGGYYLTDVFYDTQFTYMDFLGGGTAGLNFIGYNLYTGGDLCIGGEVNTMLHTSRESVLPAADANKIGPVTWAIRGNFITDFGHNFDFRSGSRIIVGGDLTVPSGVGNPYFGHNDNGYVNPSEIANKPIYIYINGDAYFKSEKLLNNVYLFINGSASGTVEPSGSNNRIFMTHPEKSSLTIRNANGLTVEPWDWDEGATGKPGLSLKEALKELDKETETIAYPKWDLAPSLTSAPHITINLNATNSARTVGGTNLDAKQGVYYIVHDENAESAKLVKDKKEQGVIGDKFVIDGINIASETNISRTIVIDTGDDPNNIVMLTAKGNYGGGKYFMWFPENNIGRDNDSLRSVIIKGRGTVLIDLPKGVTYQNSESQYVMHYGWFTIAGGTETVENNHAQFKIGNITGAKGLAAKVGPYVHKECTSGDSCTYVREVTTEECTKTDRSGNLIHPGTMRKKVTCVSTIGSTEEERKYNGHGQVGTYCPLCEPEKDNPSNDSSANWCVNHTDKVALKNYYNNTLTVKTHWQSAKTQRGETDPYGAVVYPTTNFFIVSCDEAADIRVSQSYAFSNAPTPPTPPTREELPEWAQWWSEEQRQQERDRLDAKYEEDLEKYEKDMEKYNEEIAKPLTPSSTETTKYSPLFGFIYAPYMMFQAADGEGETLKLCGGMIVSDYNINAADAYVGCYPEMMPKQLADLGGGVISSNLGGAVKSWKLQLM